MSGGAVSRVEASGGAVSAVAVSRRAPLLPAALCAWCCAAASVMVPDVAWGIALGAWSAAVLVLAVWARSTWRRIGAFRGVAWGLAVVALAAGAVAASHVALAQPARREAAELAGGERRVEVWATVSSKVEPAASGSWWFDADTSRVVVGDAHKMLRVPVAVAVEADAVSSVGGLDLGADVLVRGTLRAAGVGDRSAAVVFAVEVEVRAPPDGVLAVAAALRSGLVELARRLPGDGGDLLPGLAVGDTSAVSSALDAAMKASSLSHLMAVSGSNCAVVVGLVFAGLSALGVRRGWRVGGALAALGGFVVLVTPEPSVVRAAAMAAIAMLGVLRGRRTAGLSALSAAVVVLLAGDPWLATSLGFALSAVATAALLLLAAPLARGLSRVMPRALALLLAVPLAAQVACGPLLVLVSPVVPLYGVVANLITAPAAPVATVLGLAACLVAPVAPVLAEGLAAIAWLPASWIAGTARVAAALPSAGVPWLDGVLGMVALAVVGAAVVVLVVRPGSGQATRARDAVRGLRNPRFIRFCAGVVVATTAGVLIGAAMLRGPVGLSGAPADWSIAMCDVGQGDAAVVRSAGAVAVIDAGPEEAALESCLARLGIDRIHLLVLSHFDLDHVGGARALVGRVDLVLHGPSSGADDDALLAALRAGGAEVRSAAQGLSGGLGAARWRVLWPRAQSAAYPPGNDASVVWEVSGAGVPTAVFLGDISASPQVALAASGVLRLRYDVVKVSHHGSADQHPGLYRALGASVALIGVGADNDYGHPRAETLGFLEAQGEMVARTDRDGLILVVADGAGCRVWRAHAG